MFTPSTSWSERIPEGEAELHEKLAGRIHALQRDRAARAPLGRGLHYHSHGGVRAELSVLPDLPEWARAGIFAEAGRYEALVRFSSGSGVKQPDPTPDVRGMAVKVLGVPGKKLIPGLESATTQDFLCILTNTMPVANAEKFVGLVMAASGPPILALPRFIGLFGLFGFIPTLKRLQAGLKRPVPSLAEMTWHTPVPIRWGDTAVKYRFIPVSSQAPTALAPKDSPERLHLDLAARLSAAPVVFELQIQGFVDEATTPIEDPTVAWDDALSPPLAVARLTLPVQDLSSPEGRARHDAIEKLSFDPWHAPEAFRPLGDMMRARAPTYRESVMERRASPEPERMI